MKRATWMLAALVPLFAGVGQAQPPKKQELRYAYIGQIGTFHLIGNGGSAAYEWHGQKFVADLKFAREDANFRYYTPSNGDPDTDEWAFEKRPEWGMYWVWRSVNGNWHPAEPTRGWGVGLEGGGLGSTTSDESRFENIERDLKQHEDRIKRLEGKGSR